MPPAPRPAPRYGRFVVTGAVLGIALAALAAALATGDERYTWADVFRYLFVLGALLGGLAGGGLAAWLDRPGRAG
jgi:hypothetical protein